MTAGIARSALKTKKADREAGDRRDFSYRQLRIVAGAQNGRCRAIAYQGGRKFMETEGADVDAAAAALQEMIDGFHDQHLSKRRDGVPGPAEYADALARLDRVITPVQQTVLLRHAAMPGGRATLRQLAAAAGADESAVQRGYARLGRLLGDILQYDAEGEGLPKSLQPILVIAEPNAGATDELEWILRASVTVALDAVDGRHWFSRGRS